MNFAMHTKKTNRKVKALVLTVVIAVMAAHAFAAPTVDGKFDPSEGYTTGNYLNLNVEDTGWVTPQGQLWRYQDPGTGDLYVAFIQPTELVDNSYGSTRVGWGSKDHTFGNLLGSDKAEISIRDGLGNELYSFKMDYIAEDESVTSGNPYFSSGVQSGGNWDKGDGGMYTGSASHFLEWATSLEYNMNSHYPHDDSGLNANSPQTVSSTSYTVTDSTYADWIFEVIYEFRIDGSALSGYSGDLTVDVVHDSPNKLGKNKVWTEIDGPIQVIPAPGALVLAGIGIGMVNWLRRRRAL